MKKMLSLILAGAMLGALGVSAAAVGDEDALSAVTAKVKSALEVDTTVFDQFYGDKQENLLSPTWNLFWQGDDVDMEVTAADDGKVLRYYFNETVANVGGSYAPSFPKLSRSDAQKTAQFFLDRVLEPGVETAAFAENASTLAALSADSYRFGGTVLLNGKPSPLSFSLTVRAADNRVVRFSRDGVKDRYVGALPSPDAAVAAEDAAGNLKGTLSLRLEYVLDEEGKDAVLRYLPNSVDEYYVDAQTGVLVNLTQLAAQLRTGENGASGASPEAADVAYSRASKNDALTAAEQTGAEKLVGVLSKEELDKKAKAIPELGLSKYTLAGADYTVERTEKEDQTPANEAKVAARLTYARQESEGKIWRRYVTVDAKTGALQSVYSSMPPAGDSKDSMSSAAAEKKAAAFLSRYEKTAFAASEAYTVPSFRTLAYPGGRDYRFTYAQKVNGYFYAANTLMAEVDPRDGSISGFQKSWNDVTFEDPQGIVDESAALEAYFKTFAIPCGYIEVPQKLDLNVPEYRPLVDAGYRYYSVLKLGYALQSPHDRQVMGIDAKSGQAAYYTFYNDEQTLSYNDLEGHWIASKAQTLAQYGVGFSGGAFLPGKTLTQLDFLAFLLSTEGTRYDTADPEGANKIYSLAYQRGILEKGLREDQKILTRAETVKLLLDAAGYKSAAGLQGIYKCSFADEASIPAEYYGYAALAQGLGVVDGTGSGGFAAANAATRAEAAGMLFNLMSR